MAGNWYKGMPSPNPKGRPPRERSLTNIIERALNSRMYDPKTGRRKAKKRVMAELLSEGVTTGKVTFPGAEGEDDRVVTLDVETWVSFVMRVLNHVDGPANTGIDLNTRGDVTYRIQFIPSPGQQIEDEDADSD